VRAGAHNLALINMELGQIEKGAKLLKTVVEARIETLGVEHPDTILSMGFLVWGYWTMGWLEDAIAHLEMITRANTQLLGPKHNDTLLAKKNLAIMYGEQGDGPWIERAIKLLRNILREIPNRVGDDDKLECYLDLAWLYRIRGDLTTSRATGELALSLVRILGDGAIRGRARDEIALTCRRQQNIVNAMAFIRRASGTPEHHS
jgi:tetratricopeptide (TPR) repeat protein